MHYAMTRLGMTFAGTEGGRIVYERSGGEPRRIAFKDWDDVRRFVRDATTDYRPGDCRGCVHLCVACSGGPLARAICLKEQRERKGVRK